MSELDKIIVVFSNYNGRRRCNDLKKPRIKVTIDSFRKYVAEANDVNALLLDNNSNDGSHKLLKKYSSAKWTYKRKVQEDYYLGTLRKLVQKFYGKYRYLMLVDNDQYFFRNFSLVNAMKLMSSNNLINLQLNEMTKADAIDHKLGKRFVVGVFDEVSETGGEQWFRAARFTGKESCYRGTTFRHGLGEIRLPRYKTKRLCWNAFSAANLILEIDSVRTVLSHGRFPERFTWNGDRLALFGSLLYNQGDTAYLSKGVSINVGFRKNIPKKLSVLSLMQKYRNGVRGLILNDRHSFFLRNGRITKIGKHL